MEPATINNNGVPQRPVFLTILCILTFIFSGMGALSALTTPLFSDMLVDIVNKNLLFNDTVKPQMILLLKAGWGYYIATFIGAVGSVIGAALMWNMRKNGFHVYALSNLGMLFLPTIFLAVSVDAGSILFTMIFIGFYAVFLKLMK
jgi:hypothetical protein